MRPGTISPPPRPSPAPATKGRPWTFRRALCWVAAAHVALILLIAFWRMPAAKPAPGAVMEFTTLPGEQMAGSAPAAVAPAAAPPAAAAPAPTPPAPVTPPTPPTPPTPVEPPSEPTPPTPVDTAPEPTPAPSPAPSEIVIPAKTAAPTPPKPKKKTKPKKADAKPQAQAPAVAEQPDTPAPAPAAAHHPKVDLTQEVSRSAVVGASGAPSSAGAAAGKGAKPNPSQSAEGAGTGLTASGVADRLAKGLNGKGLDKKIEIGPPGGPSGGGGAGNQAYYDLIQKQMYGAWDQPVEFLGKHLRARIQIHIESDGTISSATLAGTSGDPAFDQSALGAARRAGRIPQPRPDDVPETVIVNFQLAE